MMTPDEIRQAIYDQIESTWATSETIAWPNHEFNEPNRSNWVRPNIRMGNTFVGESGRGSDAGVGIRNGVLILQLFAPVNTGTRNINVKAQEFESAFRRETIDGVIFREPRTYEVGVGKDGLGTKSNYFQVNVEIPFNTFIGE